jgi:hypothetical protein
MSLSVTSGDRLPMNTVARKRDSYPPLARLPHVDGAAAVWLPGVRLSLKLNLLTLVQLIEGRVFDRAAVEEQFLRRIIGLDETKPPLPY